MTDIDNIAGMAFIQNNHRSLTHFSIDLGDDREFSQFRDINRKPIFEKLKPADPKYLFIEGSLSPNRYILRILYSIRPSTALQLGITYIFGQLCGIDSANLIIERLYKTPGYMFAGFEQFYKLVLTLWLGNLQQVPKDLGETFSHEILASRARNIYLHGKRFLHFNYKMRARPARVHFRREKM